MTHIISGVMLLAIVLLGTWTQVLERRNAELTSALVVARSAANDGVACRAIVREAERGNYVGTLEAATRLAERHGPNASAAAGR